ncbi:hypothetical protein BJY59DRAFT_734272 [Rhodotorula toruloides]
MSQAKLYHTLHDQIALQHYPQALRTVSKLLRIDPSDPLALQTRSQLLIALDSYADALRSPASQGTSRLARAYCLYKLGRVDEARTELDALEEEDEGASDEEDRAREVLRAQLLYRLGEFEQARDLFDDLASTAEQVCLLLLLTRSPRSAARQSSQAGYKTSEPCTRQPSPPHSLSMSHIYRLPDELLVAIFTALRDSLRFYDNGEGRIDLERTVAVFLGPCRLVCRRWDRIALPLVTTAIQTSNPRGLLDLVDRHALEDTVKELVLVLPGELQGKLDDKVATDRRLMEEWIQVLRALGPTLRALSIRLHHELLQLDCPAVTVVDVPTVAVSDIGRFLTGLPSVKSLAFSYYSSTYDMTSVPTSSFLPTFQLPPRLRQLAIRVRADRHVHLASTLIPRLAAGLKVLAIEVERQPYDPEPNSLEQAISDFENACSSLGILFAHDLDLASDADYTPCPRRSERHSSVQDKDGDETRQTHSVGDDEESDSPESAAPSASDSDWQTDDSLDYDAEDDELFAAFWSEEKRKEVFEHNTWNGTAAQKPAEDPAATPAVPSTPHLPDELLSLIFEALWDSLRFYDNGEVRLDLGTTAAEFVGPCRLVSTRWNSLALPVLIKSVRTKKPAMLLELAQRYDLSHQVKELVIVFEVRTEPGDCATAPVPREWISKDETCATAWWTVLHRLPAYLWQILTTWTSLERPSFPNLTCLEIRSAWNEGFAYPSLMTFEPFLPYGDCFPALKELRVHLRCDQTNLTLCVKIITPRCEPPSDTVPLIRLLHSAFLQPSCKRLRYLAITGMMCCQHLDQSLFDVVFPALEVLNAPAVAIDNFDAFSISFPSALVARIICARDALSVNQMTFAHLQLPPLLRSLYMSMNRAGLIELPGFLSAQQASELELLEIEVSYPPSSRSAAYTTATDALRQIDAICDSRGIVLAHNLSVPEVVPHWRPQLTEQPAQEDEQWRWYSEAVEPENAPWPTQRDPWAPPLFEELPTEDFTSSDDDSLDYDAEDDEQFAPFWSEEKRKEVFGHNGSVDGTEDARTSSATAEGKS